jgi:Tol biopolymer transport system component
VESWRFRRRPGSWSPDGHRIVFQRYSATGDYEGMFVVNVNGNGLKRILPPTLSANCCTFNWSPQGNEIAFSRHVTPDVHSSLAGRIEPSIRPPAASLTGGLSPVTLGRGMALRVTHPLTG